MSLHYHEDEPPHFTVSAFEHQSSATIRLVVIHARYLMFSLMYILVEKLLQGKWISGKSVTEICWKKKTLMKIVLEDN